MSEKKDLKKKKSEIRKKIRRSMADLDVKDKEKLKAIAVKYDADKGRAPKIIATGKGVIAEEILKLAEENDVPLFEDEPLAELLGKLDLSSEIPPELYSVVAEVLAFIFQLDKMAKKRAKIRKKFSKLK